MGTTPTPAPVDPLADLGLGSAPQAPPPTSSDPMDIFGGGSSSVPSGPPLDYIRVPDRVTNQGTDKGRNGKHGVMVKSSF